MSHFFIPIFWLLFILILLINHLNVQFLILIKFKVIFFSYQISFCELNFQKFIFKFFKLLQFLLIIILLRWIFLCLRIIDFIFFQQSLSWIEWIFSLTWFLILLIVKSLRVKIAPLVPSPRHIESLMFNLIQNFQKCNLYFFYWLIFI